MKIVMLARNPMMDRVAIALNAGATSDELQRARDWEVAFEIAKTDLVITIPALSEEWHRRATSSS